MQPSIWEKESFFSHKNALIIGSGFAGLWTAYELVNKKSSWKICVIDRGIIPTGASTRNAGFSCFGSLSELAADAKEMGEEKMLQLVTMRFEGLKKIRRVFDNKTIGYENLGGYELFEENGKYDASLLEKEGKYLNRLLRKILHEDKTFRLSDKKIKKFGFAGLNHLVENKLEGQLHSGKLTQALIKYLQKKGVEFIFGLEATQFQKNGDRVEVETNDGFTISSDQLIICTNAFTSQLLPQLEVQPARGQVLVTSPISDLSIKGTFHYDEGFYYFRNLDNRILLGGARNKFFDEERTESFSTSNNIQSELERFLRELILPGRSDYSIDYRWSGIMGMGKEKTPEINQIDENIYYAVAMGGIGVATSPIVAERVTELMLKKKKG
jgi:glycine/D-amino acid oxidase-like deaminating enzyme